MTYQKNWHRASHHILAVIFMLWWGHGSLLSLAQEVQDTMAPGTANVYNVNGWQVRVSLVPDKSRIMLGEPVDMSFIVHNDTGQDLQMIEDGDSENELGRPNSFKIKTVGDDGQVVPQPVTHWDMGGMIGPQKIPTRGQRAIHLFLPHWATFQKPGHYTITCAFELKLSAYSPSADFPTKTHNVVTQTTASIEVVAADTTQMSAVIKSLGARIMVYHKDDAFYARRALDSIHNERTIPYWVKAFQINDYETKFAALEALARFNNAAAFAVLKQGMKTTGTEVGLVSNAQGGTDLANNIHDAAAFGLSHSPYPGAKNYLLQFANDPYFGVRLRVLQMAGDMKSVRFKPLLQKMTNDPNKMVRDEAQRYLQEMSSTSRKTKS